MLILLFLFIGVNVYGMDDDSRRTHVGGPHHIHTATGHAIIDTLRDLQSGVPTTPSNVVRFHSDGQVRDTAIHQAQEAPPVVLQMPARTQTQVNTWIRRPHMPNILCDRKKTVCGLFSLMAFAIAVVIWRLS